MLWIICIWKRIPWNGHTKTTKNWNGRDWGGGNGAKNCTSPKITFRTYTKIYKLNFLFPGQIWKEIHEEQTQKIRKTYEKQPSRGLWAGGRSDEKMRLNQHAKFKHSTLIQRVDRGKRAFFEVKKKEKTTLIFPLPIDLWAWFLSTLYKIEMSIILITKECTTLANLAPQQALPQIWPQLNFYQRSALL